MLRHEVNQGILDRFASPAYLEVGVAQGVTFHAVQAASKVANCTYYEMTSDIYFSNAKDPADKFDVVFLDGLHVFDQTLKDLLSATACLNPRGVIIIDDVIPASHAASIADPERFLAFQRARSDPDQTWMGEVYRMAFFVAAYMPFFRYATVQENHGQMVLWPGTRHATGERLEPVEAIARTDYVDALLRSAIFEIKPYAEIISEIQPRW